MTYENSLKHTEGIIEFTRYRERTVYEISENLKIPPSTVYRYLKRLVQLGWVREIKSPRRAGGNKYLAMIRIDKLIH